MISSFCDFFSYVLIKSKWKTIWLLTKTKMKGDLVPYCQGPLAVRGIWSKGTQPICDGFDSLK